MKTDKPDNKSSIAVTPADATSVIQNDEEQPLQTRSSGASKSNHVTSQMQLLNLAKHFALDGALKPAEKQAPIEERSNKRGRLSALRKQQNMERIIEKSLHYCSDSTVGDKPDADWFDSFIVLAENISNPTMQELWAKILAGEVTQPGSFSLKALQAFRQLSIHDAKLFGKACSLALKDGNKKNIRIFSGSYQQPGLLNMFDKQREQHIPLSQFGFSYSEILTLADYHLVFSQETELAPLNKGEELALKYNGLPLVISAKKNACILKFYKFTPIGAELAQLIADKPDTGFLSALKSGLSHHFYCND